VTDGSFVDLRVVKDVESEGQSSMIEMVGRGNKILCGFR
jgi:hypothetical protein